MSSKPKMQLEGQDGNIYFILGRASRLLKEHGMEVQSKEMWDRVLSSKSYEEALSIISEYVETELSPAAELNKLKKKRSAQSHSHKFKRKKDANER